MKPATDDGVGQPEAAEDERDAPARTASPPRVAIAASDQIDQREREPALGAEAIDDPAGEQEADRVGELEREDDVAVVDLAPAELAPAASA